MKDTKFKTRSFGALAALASMGMSAPSGLLSRVLQTSAKKSQGKPKFSSSELKHLRALPKLERQVEINRLFEKYRGKK